MKKEVMAAVSALVLFATPITSYANVHNMEKFNELPKTYQDALRDVNELHTMYTTTRVNIRAGADTDADIIQTVNKNTPVDVFVDDVGGWAIVTLGENNFYSFIKSEYLSPTEVKNNYTDEDLDILAHVICGEAQCYSDLCQQYVGSVVLNRVKHKGYPNTIKGVVFQPHQYSSTRDGNYYRTPTDRNWANAKYLLENGSVLPEGVIYQSRGAQGRVYDVVDGEVFCYG